MKQPFKTNRLLVPVACLFLAANGNATETESPPSTMALPAGLHTAAPISLASLPPSQRDLSIPPADIEHVEPVKQETPQPVDPAVEVPLEGIVASESGQLLPDVPVVLATGEPAVEIARTRSDASGRFTFQAPLDQEVKVAILPEGQMPAIKTITVSSNLDPITLSPGSVNHLKGQIVTSKGKPIGGVTVELSSWEGTDLLQWNSVADESGKFEWTEAPDGRLRFNLTKDGYRPVHNQMMLADGTRGRFKMFEQVEGGAGPETSQPIFARPNLLEVGDPAPEFEAVDFEGRPVRLSDFRGKFVFLDFWATWCGPCIVELPHLKEVHETFQGDPRLVILSLSLDQNASIPAQFAEENGMDWQHAFLDETTRNKVTSDYRVVGIPTTYLVDPNGKIAAVNLRGSQVLPAISRHLKSKP